MQAHCGVLRERVLRTADACFGHRLMMDRIVPGGVTADLDADGAGRLRELVTEIRRSFPELVELYVVDGVSEVVPVDLHVRGCPPVPLGCSATCSRSSSPPGLPRGGDEAADAPSRSGPNR